MELLERVPPQQIEAEECVLGSMLMSPDAVDKAIDLLRPTDFYRKAHETIFLAIRRVYAAGNPVDLVSVNAALRELEELDRCGGYTYLIELAESIPTAANVEYYARLVRLAADHRAVIAKATEVLDKAFAGDLEDPLAWFSGEAMAVADRGSSVKARRFDEVMLACVDAKNAAKVAANSPGVAPGRVRTCFQRLDNLIGGVGAGHLVIVAARPSVGKSAFAGQLAAQIAESQAPVAIFSAEMDATEIGNRFISSRAGIPGDLVVNGHLYGPQDDLFDEIAAKYAHLPILIDETESLNLGRIRSEARRWKRENGGKLGAVFVDYLQLMGGMPDDRQKKGLAANRNEEISRISRGLKLIARELDCSVFALSQLNREIEKRQGKDKRPMLSDLRDSGSLEQDANQVWFLWRGKEEYDLEAGYGTVKLSIAKNRGGRLGEVSFRFHGPTTTFRDQEG